MDFYNFATAHGLVINNVIMDSRWHRVPTTSHPRKRNGAYRHCGTHAHLQDHATMLEPELWVPEADQIAKIDHAAIARRAKAAEDQIRQGRANAAAKATWILQQCELTTHAYLASKGFPEERANVFVDENAGDNKLCIPMRFNGRIVGVQLISDKEGFEKKFLVGQRTGDATHITDNGGQWFFCEGYATGLSVRMALQALKIRYTLVVCFSAGNLLKVASRFQSGYVIADYDKQTVQAPDPGGLGIKVATELGLPFWSAGEVGMDFNDFHQKHGLFRASQSLKKLMMQGAVCTKPTGLVVNGRI
jgi:putative DNA primase/helicase